MSYFVYFIYDGAALVYIGRSGNPKRRLRDHKRRFGSHITMTTRQYESARAAYRWEEYYIARFSPAGNVQWANKMPRSQARKIWKRYGLTNKEKLALMPGWSEYSAREHLRDRRYTTG